MRLTVSCVCNAMCLCCIDVFYVGLQPFDLLTTSLDSDFPLFHAPFKEEKKLSMLAAALILI